MNGQLESRPMSPLTAVALIARREFVTRVRTRVFLIGTAVILAALAGFVVLQVLVLSKQSTVTTFKVAFLGEAQSLADPLNAASKGLQFKIERHQVGGLAQAETQVTNGDLDVVISGSATAPDVVVRNQLDTTLQAVLQAIVRQQALDSQLAAAGLSPATVEANIASATIHLKTLQHADTQRLTEVTSGFVVALFLYVALLTYGQFIAQGVVEEKANRIVEILLSTVRPGQLLIGKVVGIGLVGLFQLGVIGVVAFVLVTATGIFAVPAAAATVVLAGLLWFILGFFLYAILFAAAGSLVSRQEDVQSVVLPITMLTVLSWFVAIGVLTPMWSGQPMSSTGILLALIPPLSPVLMPSGMATGDIAPWQVLAAVALTLITAAAATWVAARIYSNSVLRIGARVKLREALSSR
jgi:ABC-2 type transport system permease protein